MNSKKTQGNKVGWSEKVKTLSTIFATIIIPIVIGYTGNEYSKAIKDKETQGRFVELAVNILKQEPTKESRNLRDWATRVIDKYSGVPFSDSTREDLLEHIPILSSWSLQNRSNTTTWLTLRTLGQIAQDITFQTSGNIKLSELQYWSVKPEGEILKRARALAIQLDKIFRDIRGARYQEGMDYEKAVGAMMSILSDGTKTVNDLAAVNDQTYIFWGGKG